MQVFFFLLLPLLDGANYGGPRLHGYLSEYMYLYRNFRTIILAMFSIVETKSTYGFRRKLAQFAASLFVTSTDQ